MSLTELYKKPGHLVRRAHQISWALFLEECAAFNLTPVQYAAMVAIQEHPGVDATRLSSLIAFDRSTIGNVVERLEGRGLLQRKPSDEDRRLKRLYLTRSGAALVRKAEPCVARVQARLLAPLTEAEQRRFLALLSKLAAVNNEATSAPLRAGKPSLPQAGRRRA